jgi:4'-phosphopantetheinyl transferase
LWTWSLDGPVPETLASLLSEDEQARRGRYRFVRDRDGFAIARGRMRQILGGHLQAPPQSLVFDYGQHGKPRLAGGPAFNFSDSGQLGCLAVSISGAAAVGIDIEEMGPRDYLKLGERYFSPAEFNRLKILKESDHAASFFRAWTRKEAFLKAVGTGLSTRLDAFETSMGPCEPARMLRIDAAHFPGLDAEVAGWKLHAFEPAKGYMGAIAAHTGGTEIEVVVRQTP